MLKHINLSKNLSEKIEETEKFNKEIHEDLNKVFIK